MDRSLRGVGGSAATLTGLTFVAISLNIRHILEHGGIAERALAAVLELLGVAIVAVLALAPQPRLALGIELSVLGGGLSAGGLALLALSIGRRPPGEPRYAISGLLSTIPGVLCFLIGGVSLIVRSDGGLYWILGGIVLSLIGGVSTAWVLLIEILR